MLQYIEKAAEEAALRISLHSPWFFRNVARPWLYWQCENDAEKVHEEALRMLQKYENVLEKHGNDFDFPELHVRIKGIDIKPFGTAAGFDKNGDALAPLSHVYGFLTPGTVTYNQRDGNPKPRLVADDKKEEAYNAQGFPSEGIDYFLSKLRSYRQQKKTNGPAIIPSICGVPESANDMELAMLQTDYLILALRQHVEGLEWNPYSPNTDALKFLRTPKVYSETAGLMKKHMPAKLKLVKMGPYDGEQRQEWIKLAEAWLEGGGDGFTVVNAYPVKKEEVPAEEWGYHAAGRSGRFLHRYRMKAVRYMRRTFPDAVIFAAGGISDGDDAYNTFLEGADAVEGYTPYTFHGLGLARKIMQRTSELLQSRDYKSLEVLRSGRR